MSGTNLVIERMSDHDYSATAQGTAQTLFVLLMELDVSQYREGTLEVLVKDATIPTGASITIEVFAIARTDDDAGKVYASSAAVASVVINTNTSGKLMVGAFSANFGASVGVAISAATSTTAGTFKGTFETRVSLKN